MKKNTPASTQNIAGDKYAAYRKKEKSTQKPEHFKSTLLRLVSMLKPYKVSVIVVFIVAALATVLNIFTPDIFGDIVESFTVEINNKLNIAGYDMNFDTVIGQLIKIFVFYFGYTLCTFIQTYIMAGVSQKLICAIREKVNHKLSHMPLRYFDKNTKGEILSKIINDCDNLSNSLQNNITTVLTAAIQVIGVAIIMFVINWQLAIVSMVLVPISGFFARIISKRSKKLFRLYWDRMGDLNGHIEEMYTGHNIVRIFNHEKEAIAEFDGIADELQVSSVKANFVSGLLRPILNFFSNFTYVLVCFVGAMIVLNLEQTQPGHLNTNIGIIIAFIQYASMFSGPINNIASIVNTIQSCLASAERVFSLLDEKDEPADNPVYTLDHPRGDVKFSHVSFRYLPEKPLIDDLNLEAKKGQIVAIVGPTGAGKTTLVNLLMRFYEIDSGSITIDGIDIREVSRENLRSNFGMVLQDTWIFKGTIRQNIAYGRMDATDDEIIEAAKAARLHEFIMSQPEGYDTVLEENGSNISQGQRQLLSIARALLTDPAVLILDEATSSVDTRTEVQIQEAMNHLMQGRTNFVIAHRLSTIKNADIILVMRRGAIVEQGSHEELLEKGGFYASLYNSQYQGGIPPEDTE